MTSKVKWWLFMISTIILLVFTSVIASYGESAQYVYDELNRLIQIRYGDGTVINYSYDQAGNRMGGMTVEVLPVALCQSVTVPADSTCQANASINNGSYDPSGYALTPAQSPAGPYPLGSTPVTLTVTNSQGLSKQCSGTVTVVDQTPPTITSASASPSTLWPPNHKMVNVAVNYNATDNCCQPTCQITGVTCNEPISGSDYLIVDGHHVKLSADRLGSGNGRIYTITITCTDTSGNSTSQAVKVSVPHDQGK